MKSLPLIPPEKVAALLKTVPKSVVEDMLAQSLHESIMEEELGRVQDVLGVSAVASDDMPPGYHAVRIANVSPPAYAPVFLWLKEHLGPNIFSWHIVPLPDYDRTKILVEFRFEDADLAFHFKVRWS